MSQRKVPYVVPQHVTRWTPASGQSCQSMTYGLTVPFPTDPVLACASLQDDCELVKAFEPQELASCVQTSSWSTMASSLQPDQATLAQLSHSCTVKAGHMPRRVLLLCHMLLPPISCLIWRQGVFSGLRNRLLSDSCRLEDAASRLASLESLRACI